MNNFKDIYGLWDTLSGLVTGTEAEVIGKFPTESFCIFQIIHTLRFCWKINVEHFYDYFSLKQYCLIKESYIIVMQNFHNFFFFGWNKHMYIINEYNAENSVIVSWDQKRILGNTVLFCYLKGVPVLAFRGTHYGFGWISASGIEASFLILLILRVYRGLWAAVILFGAGSGSRVGWRTVGTVGGVQFLLFTRFLLVRTKLSFRARYTTRMYHVYY